MASVEEHWFTLDYAMRHCSWLPEDRFGYEGWEAGGEDIFNLLTALPDNVGDWLWQKAPFASSVVRFGLQRIRQDAEASGLSAALKMALLSHYLADAVSVSHTWLDFMGDETDFAFDERHEAIRHFHDPVECRVAGLLRSFVVSDESGVAADRTFVPDYDRVPFASEYQRSVTRAYTLGKELFDLYFANLKRVAAHQTTEAAIPPLETLNTVQLRGVENTCRAMWALWEWGLRDGGEGLPYDERHVKHWTLKPLLEWSAEELIARASLPETITAFRQSQGWSGGDIFRAPERCSEQAREELALWQKDREEWRTVNMAGVLPPRPTARIDVGWRPEP